MTSTLPYKVFMLACYPHKIKRFNTSGTLSGSGTEERHALQALMEHLLHQKCLSQQTQMRSTTVPESSAALDGAEAERDVH